MGPDPSSPHDDDAVRLLRELRARMNAEPLPVPEHERPRLAERLVALRSAIFGAAGIAGMAAVGAAIWWPSPEPAAAPRVAETASSRSDAFGTRFAVASTQPADLRPASPPAAETPAAEPLRPKSVATVPITIVQPQVATGTNDRFAALAPAERDVSPAPAPAPAPAPPVEAAPQPAAAPPQLAEPARPMPALPAQVVEHLLERAQAFRRSGDIISMRAVLEPAARGGDPRALLLLAQTFDPAALREWGVWGGIRPDPSRARSLYEQAAAAGAPDAAARLARLRQD